MWLCALFLLQSDATAGVAQDLAPMLRAHCVDCHAAPRPKGDLDLAAWLKTGATAPGTEALERVRERLALGEMPPADRPQPTAAELDVALNWLEANLPRSEAARPTLRRLNRSQYERTVRDLFGVAYPARELFPADDVGAQFDNEAAVASISELGVERWIEAAERVALRALPPEAESTTRKYGPKELETAGGAKRNPKSIGMSSNGSAVVRTTIPRESRYRITVEVTADQAGDEKARIAFDLDGRSMAEREITAERPELETLELILALPEGDHALAVRFVNDYYKPDHPDPKGRDRNVSVASITVTGPLDPPPKSEFLGWIDGELERGSRAGAIAALGQRVWRRPLTAKERQRLSALGKPATSDRERLRMALVSLLASPHFLYRVEATAIGEELGDFELATRLSYFLWASAPDPRLLKLAADGELQHASARSAEIRRMLRDARSRSIVEEFAAQWLGWRALESTTPDPRAFPDADSALTSSMRQESEAFFEAMLREDRDLDEFIDADFTFVDARLAKLYGMEGVEGDGLRRVRILDEVRGGLLGQAALLTVSSNPTRTSPVKRGKWILETLLGSRVPPPPPGVDALEESTGSGARLRLREQLELHRSKQECAGCHVRLDPLGFALEGFDAIGRLRTHDGDVELDVRGVTADGTELNGVGDLKRYLLERGAFPRALGRALFAYALGREPSRSEDRALLIDIDAIDPRSRNLAAVIDLVCKQPAFLRAGVQ